MKTPKKTPEETPQKTGKGRAYPLWAFLGGGVILLTLAIVLGIRAKSPAPKEGVSGNSMAKVESPPASSPSLPLTTPSKLPEGIELFSSEGDAHVADGVRVSYKTDPPTSGNHSSQWAPPGVYEAGQVPFELLVHNLEHGNIVIYFDRARLAKQQVDDLTDLPRKYGAQWDGVVLVGRPDKNHPVILTGWRAMLRLKGYDQEKITGFMEAFRGRGPENPVR